MAERSWPQAERSDSALRLRKRGKRGFGVWKSSAPIDIASQASEDLEGHCCRSESLSFFRSLLVAQGPDWTCSPGRLCVSCMLQADATNTNQAYRSSESLVLRGLRVAHGLRDAAPLHTPFCIWKPWYGVGKNGLKPSTTA